MKILSRDLLRLIDANYNRASEGLRVLEDTARMVFDDDGLTRNIKHLRHSLNVTVASMAGGAGGLLFARDADGDVLRSGETATESVRSSLYAVIRANARRAEEALRALEEFGKLASADSATIKEIRFSLYTLEKRLVERNADEKRRARVACGCALMVDRFGEEGPSVAEWCGEKGITLLLYMNNDLTAAERIADIRRFREQSEYGRECCTILVYDRVDVMHAAEAQGVILDATGPPASRVRSLMSRDNVLCRSLTAPGGKNGEVPGEADMLVVDRFSEETAAVIGGLEPPDSSSAVFTGDMDGVEKNRAVSGVPCPGLVLWWRGAETGRLDAEYERVRMLSER